MFNRFTEMTKRMYYLLGKAFRSTQMSQKLHVEVLPQPLWLHPPGKACRLAIMLYQLHVMMLILFIAAASRDDHFSIHVMKLIPSVNKRTGTSKSFAILYGYGRTCSFVDSRY